MATKKNEDNGWYLFRLNEEKDWVKVRKSFKSKDEALNYALDHKYDFSMVSNSPELVHTGDRM